MSRTIKLKLITVVILASATIASANLIPLGSVTFTGNFTLNHLYDFNHPASQPFGWWDDQTVTHSTGIFSPDVQHGDILGGQALWTVKNLPLFTLGGFTFITASVGIFGADSGRFVQGIVDLSGNGYPGGDIVAWQFTAPPYDIAHFEHDYWPDHADVPGVARDSSRRWRHIDAIGCRPRGVIQLQTPCTV